MSETIGFATLGAGCFWCVEAVFQELEGVIEVKSGYTGGHVRNPAYREVCTGSTGHAEVAQIKYDKAKLDFSTLLEVFFVTHDPTTLNRQGGDVGTQYRSEIFCHDDEQFRIATAAVAAANESGNWSSPIVTAVSMIREFFPAEEDHNDYYRLNPEQGYCRMVIRPKVDKFKKLFADRIKS